MFTIGRRPPPAIATTKSPRVMTSHRDNSSPWRSQVSLSKVQLSDSLVGRVLVRKRTRCHNIDFAKSFRRSTTLCNSPSCSFIIRDDTTDFKFQVSEKNSTSRRSTLDATYTQKRRVYKGTSQREQLRSKQARYRNKQRDTVLHLKQSTKQLYQEIHRLKCVHRDLALDKSINHSSRTIVTKIFALLETNFRHPWRLKTAAESLKLSNPWQRLLDAQTSFAGNLAVGDLYGVNALVKQLQYYWKYFEDPDIQLQRVNAVALGVVAATTMLRMTVSERTLRRVFPRLENRQVGDGTDGHQSLRDQLLGKRLCCKCVINFYFDEESAHVAHVNTRVDLVGPLFRALGSFRGVLAALGQAW